MITGTRPSTADRTAIRRSLRSSTSRAAASPVEPATTTASTPWSTRRAAWSAVAGASISPSSSNSVTSATPTPVKTGATCAIASTVRLDSVVPTMDHPGRGLVAWLHDDLVDVDAGGPSCRPLDAVRDVVRGQRIHPVVDGSRPRLVAAEAHDRELGLDHAR